MARASRHMSFLIAGAANTAVGLAFYPLLLWAVPMLRTHYLIALLIAQACCLCFAYTTYKLGVFHTRGNVLREFSAFSSYYLFNYAANWMALPLLVELARIQPVLAQTGFTALLVTGSWFWHNHVTFRVGPGLGRAFQAAASAPSKPDAKTR